METIPVTHRFIDLDRVLDRLAERQGSLLTAHLSDEDKLARVVGDLAAEELARRGFIKFRGYSKSILKDKGKVL